MAGDKRMVISALRRRADRRGGRWRRLDWPPVERRSEPFGGMAMKLGRVAAAALAAVAMMSRPAYAWD
ncbi:MAG TPA: hypothetical protein VF771_19665, partial [Longimicrobiaceae bacterium]